VRAFSFALPLLALGCAGAGSTPRALRDFRGIIHCHSMYSHDSKGTYPEILAAAKAAKVDFVVITDHPPDDRGLPLREGWRGLRDGVLFIQGAELAGSNLLAVGIREPVSGGTIYEKILSIRMQGGLAFVSHPEEVKDWEAYSTADGMEVYNVHAALKRRTKSDPELIPRAIEMLATDPERVFTLLQETDPAILRRWEEENKRRPFTGIAGNDAHQNVKLAGYQVDPYERAFKFVSTHVLAEELTEPAVLDALKRGRCYVAFEVLPPGQPVGGGGRTEEGVIRHPDGRPWMILNPPLRGERP
jgi:hypothetical protein